MAAVVMSSCDSAPAPAQTEQELVCAESVNSGELWPLEKGNFWNYKITDYNEAIVDSLLIEVVSELPASENNSRLFVVRNSFTSRPGDFTEKVWKSVESGVEMVGVISPTDTLWAKIFHLPNNPNLGDSFYAYNIRANSSGEAELRDSTLYTVSSLSTPVVVKGQTFSAVTFEHFFWIVPDANPDEVRTHYKHGVGLVAREQHIFRPAPGDLPRYFHQLIDWCVYTMK